MKRYCSVTCLVCLLPCLELVLSLPVVLAQAGPLVPPQQAFQPGGPAQEAMQKGEALLAQGRWDEAIKELKKALRLDASLAGARANLGMAYYFKGETSAAVSALQEALDTNPERVDAAHGLGLALSDQGDFAGAVAAFRQATRMNPQAYYNLGNALEHQGDVDGAMEAYRQYLAAGPKTQEARALKPAIDAGISPTPAAGTAKEHFLRGQTLLAKKDADAAVTEFLVALRLKPNYAEASNQLGQAFRLKGALDEAIGSYMMALRLDPNFGAVHRNIGQAFEESGNLEAAAQAYDRYLILVPGAADASAIRDKIAELRKNLR